MIITITVDNYNDKYDDNYNDKYDYNDNCW